MARKLLVALAASGAVLAWWLSTPPTEVAFSDVCEPRGTRAWISEKFDSAAYWSRQLDAAKRERKRLEEEPTERARMDAEFARVLAEIDAGLEKFEQEYPDQRASLAAQRAQALRDEADAIEMAELERWMESLRLERIATLMRCELLIATRL